MKAYHVIYDRDETGWWQARVDEVPGCHTQGRTVDEARRRIREALGLFVERAGRAKLVDRVQLPADAMRAIREYETLSEQSDDIEVRKARAAVKAVKILQGRRLKLSTRDAAGVIGVSHQRISQWVNKSPMTSAVSGRTTERRKRRA